METEINGLKIYVDIIGGFQFEGNEYAVCSYEDEEDNHKIIILQTEMVGNVIKTKEIPEEDVEKVMNCYEQIKNNIMEDEDE